MSFWAIMVLLLYMIQSKVMNISENVYLCVFTLQVTSAERQDFIIYSVHFGLVTIMFFLSTFSDKGALTQRSSNENREDIPLIGMMDQVQENTREDENVDFHNKVLTLENKRSNVSKVYFNQKDFNYII